MSVCPKHAWGGVEAMLHSVLDQVDAEIVAHQYEELLDNTPAARGARHLDEHGGDVLVFCAFSKACGARSGPTIPSASTARSDAAPTWSGSFPTAARSSGSSARSWSSRMTNGPTAAATSDSTSSPRANPP